MFAYPHEVAELIKNGKKLEAIAKLREMRGLSLVMAKAFVNAFNEDSLIAQPIIENKMIHQKNYDSVVELFSDALINDCVLWSINCNSSDAVLLPANDARRGIFRSNFGISGDETILFYRDTGFWNNGDQGLVITDKGIYVIPDNEDSSSYFKFGWDIITDVTLQEGYLLFWDGTDQPYRLPFEYFGKDSLYEFVEDLPSLFTKIAQMVDNPTDGIAQEFKRIWDSKGRDEAIQYALIKVKEDNRAAFLYSDIARYYLSQEDWNKVLEYSNEGLKYYDPGTWGYTRLRDIRSDAYKNLGEYILARKDYFNTFVNATDDMMWGDDKAKDLADVLFDQTDALVSEKILELPYRERKIIMPVRTYRRLDDINSFIMVNADLPSPIEYPVGHPIENQLYVGHPYIATKYMPFETYQLELIEDKVREFCFLAQCLGASEISIECLNTNNASRDSAIQNLSQGEGGNFLVNGKFDTKSNFTNKMVNELSRSVTLNQTYEPHNAPFLPEGLIWYSNEPSWQRLVTQRLNGGLLTHEERIESKKSQMVDKKELQSLKVDIETFYADANIQMTNEEVGKFEQQENAILSIKVKFASLQELGPKDASTSTTHELPQKISSLEQEYLDELKEVLADGEIGPRERRLLNKIRERLGISEERARELEKFVTPSLSAEEQEYIKEYKEIISDGEISARDQRFLDKLKKANGISEERAKEIESMA